MMKKMFIIIGILILLCSVACACLSFSYHPHPQMPPHPCPPYPWPTQLPTVEPTEEPTAMPTVQPTIHPGNGDKIVNGRRNMFAMGMITAIQDMQRNPAICHEIKTVSRFSRYPQFEKGYDLMVKKILSYRVKIGVC